MTWLRSEEEVDAMIKDMTERTKGKYLTQGVSFNKTCPRQMNLLKKALMSSVSFSGLGKELLAIRFGSGGIQDVLLSTQNEVKKINTGNFI
jgi:hypothetical protein